MFQNRIVVFSFLLIVSLLSIVSCSPAKEKREVALYNNYCGSCHLAPAIQDLPRHIWETEVLPEMGARMGIRDTSYNPYKGISLTEQGFILKTNIYPYQPLLPEEDWNLLKAYILKLAPDSLPVAKTGQPVKEQQQFKSHPISLDTIPGTLITFLEFDKKHNSVLTGDLYGNLYSHKVTEKKSEFLKRYGSGLTAYSEQGGVGG